MCSQNTRTRSTATSSRTICPTLLWLGQIGTLEFHIWHSRVAVGDDAITQSTDFDSSIEALEGSVANYPDYLVFDIDPYIYSGKEAKGAEPEYNKKAFAVGKKVAFWLHTLLKEMSAGSDRENLRQNRLARVRSDLPDIHVH